MEIEKNIAMCQWFDMNLLESIEKKLSDMVGEGKRFKTNAELARYCEVEPSYTHKLLKGGSGKKTLEPFTKLLDKLGVKVVFPEDEPNQETARDVCFVDAKIVPAGEGMPKPDAENYAAIPMVGEAAAGPGIIPQDELRSWLLVYRMHSSVARRNNLIGVEIGHNQRSMIPTLHPHDIVLVDRDDWGDGIFSPPGNIYLVREPGQEGGAMVKRVALSGTGDKTTITFYSDNTEYAPITYHMYEYNNDFKEAIVGKVVWAWSDLSRK